MTPPVCTGAHRRALHRHGSTRAQAVCACLAGLAIATCTAASSDTDVARRPAFEHVQPDLFAASGAQPNAWADFDRDGDLDLFVGFAGSPDRLYRNDDGIFIDIAASVGLAGSAAEAETRAAAWGDFDGDGDLDLYLGLVSTAETPVRNRLYRNDGERFIDVAAEMGVGHAGVSRQPSFVDYDGDGDVDLFVAFRDQPNRLWRNDGGTFTDVTDASGIGDPRRTVGAVWFDADMDGNLDLFVANQNGDEDGLFRNLGDGTFRDVAAELGMHQPGRTAGQGSVGVAVADFDNDGDLDLFIASYGPDLIWENRGAGAGFVRRSAGTGLEADRHSVAAAAGDFDNDGRVDLYVGAYLDSIPEYADALFRNTAQRFEAVTPVAVLQHGASHGVAWADFDRDGDLDLALANNNAAGRHPLYRNLLPIADAGQSLQVVVLDAQGRWTRAGAEVRLRDARTGAMLGTRLVDTGGGYCSQGAVPAHFGIPPGVEHVHVEVTVMAGGQREVTVVKQVRPAVYAGRWLEIRH